MDNGKNKLDLSGSKSEKIPSVQDVDQVVPPKEHRPSKDKKKTPKLERATSFSRRKSDHLELRFEKTPSVSPSKSKPIPTLVMTPIEEIRIDTEEGVEEQKPVSKEKENYSPTNNSLLQPQRKRASIMKRESLSPSKNFSSQDLLPPVKALIRSETGDQILAVQLALEKKKIRT
jgi:hypothetical protein